MSTTTTATPALTPDYLLSLPSIRARSAKVYDLAKQGQLDCFDLHQEKLEDVVDYCINVIHRDYGTAYTSIPPHSRWRHFSTPSTPDLLQPLIDRWKEEDVGEEEMTKRLLDLFVVSVLLDAGAGPTWTYTSESGEKVSRSEGLAVASLEMFQRGFFGSDEDGAGIVTSKGLRSLTPQSIGQALQVTKTNPMTGLEGRSSLLLNLGEVLDSSPFFAPAASSSSSSSAQEKGVHQTLHRPGNLIHHLHPTTRGSYRVADLWKVIIIGMKDVWPSRGLEMDGHGLGDAWVCESLRRVESGEGAGIVTFHKLSQWLTYSLLEPLQKIMGWEFEGVEELTGLPEYRNGGLLLDLGMLTLKPSFTNADQSPPSFPPSSQVIIEWRALTVIALDLVADRIKRKLGPEAGEMTTAQVLESATWKAGRKVAREKRGGGPPIEIVSDGTVF